MCLASSGGYTEDLSEALRRHRENREGLAEREGQAAERLPEAELRYAVGEYDESKWRELHSDVQTALGTAREDLKRVDEEIGRLEEVMVLVEGKKAALARASEEIPPPPRRASASVPSPPPVGASPPSRGQPQRGARTVDVADECVRRARVLEVGDGRRYAWPRGVAR